ncbi:MAG: sensor histidine kinase [Vicinamibacterales bacterium]|nr:sensor histidine kinase [Vicinamibacterales bacterium]
MRRVLLGRLTIRTALGLGFGLSLGLWLFTGYAFTTRLTEAEREASAVTARYLKAQDLLATVRAQVLLSSVFVRDALMDPELALPDHRERIELAHGTIDEALRDYIPVIDAGTEQEEIDRLRVAVEQFRRTTWDVLEADLGHASVRDLLNDRIVPRREAAVRVSEQVQAINRTAYVQQQVVTADIHRIAQRQSWQRLGLGLTASLAIALIATVYAGRLEKRLLAQLEKDAQNTRDLQRLSSKLITAQEEERRSIARELHDEVGQVLTAVNVEISLAQRALELKGGGGHLLDEAQAVTDSALQSVRDLSQLLHPAVLDDLGLPAAIDWYLRGIARRHGLRVDLEQAGMPERVAADTEVAAYRIVQEAVTNIVRHANARTCHVRLVHTTAEGGALTVEVEDDGTGFDAEAMGRIGAQRGLGMVGIRERVAQLRGTLTVDSVPGRGTRVVVRLPAAEHAPSDRPLEARGA